MSSSAAWLLLLMPLVSPAVTAQVDRWTALYGELQEIQVRHRVPMLTLVIADAGRPVLVGAGGPAADVGPDTPFRWGSISKTVTALVLLEAAARRATPLDTPVGDLLDTLPFRNRWQASHPLRLAHLLELAAGLPDLTRDEFADNTPRPLAEALARHADARVMLWPPGLQHSYSNVPPGISAAVVERLTGETFEAAARRLVFAPLGMAGASFDPVDGLPGGFQADGMTPIPYWHVTFTAFGGLNASPAAMARLLTALLDQGRVAGRRRVSAASVARMYRPQATAGAAAGLEIGYGAGLYGWVTDGHLFHGHGGDADGYRSRLGLLPDAGRGYLVGIDVDDADLLVTLQRRVEQALIADLPRPVPPAATAVSATDLAGYAGTYYPASSRFSIDRWRAGEASRARISVTDGTLTVRRADRAQPLVPLGAGRFRRPRDPAVSVVFVERDDTLFMQGELGNYARISQAPCASYVPTCDTAARVTPPAPGLAKTPALWHGRLRPSQRSDP